MKPDFANSHIPQSEHISAPHPHDAPATHTRYPRRPAAQSIAKQYSLCRQKALGAQTSRTSRMPRRAVVAPRCACASSLPRVSALMELGHVQVHAIGLLDARDAVSQRSEQPAIGRVVRAVASIAAADEH